VAERITGIDREWGLTGGLPPGEVEKFRIRYKRNGLWSEYSAEYSYTW